MGTTVHDIVSKGCMWESRRACCVLVVERKAAVHEQRATPSALGPLPPFARVAPRVVPPSPPYLLTLPTYPNSHCDVMCSYLPDPLSGVPEGDAAGCYLLNVVVAEEQRGLGVGKRVMRAAMSRAVSHWGAQRLYTHVEADNEVRTGGMVCVWGCFVVVECVNEHRQRNR